MDYKTKVKSIDHDGAAEAPGRVMSRNVSGLAHDISTLIELQWKLVTLDLKRGMGRLMTPTGLVVLAVALGLAAVPLVLAGIALLLVEYADMIPAWAFLVTALGALVVAALLAWIAYARLRHSFDTLQRSREEFMRNVQWIKSALQHPGEAPAHAQTTR